MVSAPKPFDNQEYLANKYLITNSIENSDIDYSVKNSISEKDEKNKNNIRPLGQIIKTPRKSVVPRSKKQFKP